MLTRTVIFLMSCLFIGAATAAYGADDGVSAALFEHIADGKTLHLFPGVPAITLPGFMTVHLLMLWIAAALILIVFIAGFRKRTLTLRGLGAALEALVVFVRDEIVYPVMGREQGAAWVPFFTTLFVFLLTVNYLGLIPAGATATGNLTVTSALALMILTLMVVVGVRRLGAAGFFKNMYPADVPWPIALFVFLLELLGNLVRTAVLSIRLFANMFAGHLAILTFLMLIFVISRYFAVVAVPFAVFTYALEVLIALIQALVFTLLSCMFISMASRAH